MSTRAQLFLNSKNELFYKMTETLSAVTQKNLTVAEIHNVLAITR